MEFEVFNYLGFCLFVWFEVFTSQSTETGSSYNHSFFKSFHLWSHLLCVKSERSEETVMFTGLSEPSLLAYA